MALTDQQEAFAQQYVIDYNATQAAIRAGYSENSARQQGSRLLTNADIAARVTELSNASADELGLTKRRILTRLWDAIEKAYEGAPKTDRNGGPVIVDGEQVIEWAPASVIRGVELLLKHRGELVDQVSHSGGIDIRVNGVDVDALK